MSGAWSARSTNKPSPTGRNNGGLGGAGHDRHLAVLIDFTNDPYVDNDNPRQYDNFTFDFPQIKLGADGHTFYYLTPEGRSLPVAVE